MWTPLELTADFGRPVLLPAEAEQLQEAGVRLYDGDTPTARDEGTLTVTTHRIFWVVRCSYLVSSLHCSFGCDVARMLQCPCIWLVLACCIMCTVGADFF